MTRGKVTATDGLEITADHGEDGTIVRLHGRLSIDSSPRLRDQLLAMLGVLALFEMSGCTSISSASKVS